MIDKPLNLIQAFQAGDADAVDRVHQHLPQVKYGAREDAAAFPLTLSEAQTVIARENGAKSWSELRLRAKLEALNYGDELEQFKQLVYAKDAAKLDELLTAHPSLKATIDDPHFYFGSTALIIVKEHIDAVDVLLQHGADINARSQWWAGDFHILEVTSAQAAEILMVELGAEITVHGGRRTRLAGLAGRRHTSATRRSSIGAAAMAKRRCIMRRIRR